MNKIRKILLSILSIPMVLSSSVARASTFIEVFHNGQKVEFDKQKMEEAIGLFKRVNERFESTNSKLGKVKDTLEPCDIDINNASTYKKVIEVLKENNTLNCKSIDFIKSWVGTYLGYSEVDFVINNCYNLTNISSYIEDIRELKSIEDKFNKLSHEEQEKETDEKTKIEQKKGQMRNKYGRCSTSDDLDCISLCAGAASQALAARLCVKDVLKSCCELRCVSNVKNVLCELSRILKNNFRNDSDLCANTLLPLLKAAISLKSENSRYGKALKDHNLQYWYNDQYWWVKKLGNFITFADTSPKGKADRAIDNYIKEMKTALGEESPSSHVGTYLLLGTVVVGGSVYFLYESADGEVVCVQKQYAHEYDQEYEYNEDDDE